MGYLGINFYDGYGRITGMESGWLPNMFWEMVAMFEQSGLQKMQLKIKTFCITLVSCGVYIVGFILNIVAGVGCFCR